MMNIELMKAIPWAAFFGTITALAGIAYNNNQQLKRLKEQHIYDTEQRQFQLIIEKAEELQGLINNWIKIYNANFKFINDAIESKTTGRLILDDVNEYPKDDLVDYQRMSVLFEMYFPDFCVDYYKAVEKSNQTKKLWLLAKNKLSAADDENLQTFINSLNALTEQTTILKLDCINKIRSMYGSLT